MGCSCLTPEPPGTSTAPSTGRVARVPELPWWGSPRSFSRRHWRGLQEGGIELRSGMTPPKLGQGEEADARLTPGTGGPVSPGGNGAPTHCSPPPYPWTPICPGPCSGLDPAAPLLRTIRRATPAALETPGMAKIRTLRSYGNSGGRFTKCVLISGTSRKPVRPGDLEQGVLPAPWGVSGEKAPVGSPP